MDKTLFLIRGAPGSGKTTLAKSIAPASSVAADDFMVDENGNYSFDYKRLEECHEKCQKSVEFLMQKGVSDICVHNTFIQMWEMEAYKHLAQKHGYVVFTLECQNNFGNIHGCSLDKVEGMKERIERVY